MARFCDHCGTELNGGVRFCPQCGAPVDNRQAQQGLDQSSADSNYSPSNYYNQNTYAGQPADPSNARPQGYVLSILAVVFGALGGWLGLLFGILGLCQNKSGDPGVKTRSIIGMVLFGIWIVILIAL